MTVLNYKLVGSGPTKVLAAHSWLADHRTYEPAFPYLDTERYTFAFPDFRGYGGSKDIPGTYSVREMGEDLIAVSEKLGWDSFHVVGHSMGGQVAQWLAGNRHVSERIQSLFLACSVPARGFPLDEQGAAFFGAAADNMDVRGQCATAVTAGRLGPAFARYMSLLSFESASPSAIRGYLKSWTQEDISGELSAYPGRVRIYVGQFDPVLTEDISRQHIASYFPQASLETIAGAAHYPAQETPAYFAGLLNMLEPDGAGQ